MRFKRYGLILLNCHCNVIFGIFVVQIMPFYGLNNNPMDYSHEQQ